MALELTRKGNKDKKPKSAGQKNDVLLKIMGFFEKNPIMKIIIPVLLFVILAGIFLFVVFGDGIFAGKDGGAEVSTDPAATNTVQVLPGNNTITDEDVVALIEKDPLSEDILASAKYTGCVVGSSGLKTGLIQIGEDGDTLVLTLGETVGESSWEVTEIASNYIVFKAGDTVKKLSK